MMNGELGKITIKMYKTQFTKLKCQSVSLERPIAAASELVSRTVVKSWLVVGKNPFRAKVP